MRRKDRELTSVTDILHVIDMCKICRVCFVDDGKPYIVPLNFGYAYKDGRLVLYFHGAVSGRKMALAAQNGIAAFEMDGEHGLIGGRNACHHSYRYVSVCGSGRVSMVNDANERLMAIKHLIVHQTGRMFDIDAKMMEQTAVFKIMVEEVTGKAHLDIS